MAWEYLYSTGHEGQPPPGEGGTPAIGEAPHEPIDLRP